MVALEILYAALVFALDLPTGAVADRWGRKKMLLLARAFMALEFLTLGFAADFGMFLAGTVSAALGTVCFSGAGNAFVYDSLQQRGREKEWVL